jgi:4-cresol dehydrogenase (hydroxylating) flavoprotein subunit
MRYAPYERALTEWSDALGAENVSTEAPALRAAETGTFDTTHRIPAIIRPGNRKEVQECLRIANRYATPIYPVSSGRNWGYGSRMPSSDGCVLMDLGRMNRILDFSESLAYVTVEPGVTQAQLFAFLEERGSKLWMDATGASPQCSLIGNTVERGFGHTPYGDHFAHICGLEVVLPTGDVVETGFARFPSAQAASCYNWGVGPALDGLFSQSNYGIVTRMTVWLMPQPEYFQAYYFSCEEASGLRAAIDALRPLRLDGTIRSASHIANDYKVVSALRQYPWVETGGQTPLQGAIMAQLRKELRIGAWNGSGALYGSKRQVQEGRRLLRNALRGKAQRLQFLDDRTLHLASLFAKPYRWLSGWDLERTLAVLKPVYGLMKGIPTEHPLASTYWRKTAPPPAQMDPDRDRCGLLWCSPVAPNDGAAASHLTGLINERVLAHGYEPAISLTMISGRALACIISLAYDRDIPGEDEKAMSCYRNLVDVLAQHGYHSYRLAVGTMSAMGAGPYSQLLTTIKTAIDPRYILAPGRYVLDLQSPGKPAVTIGTFVR